MMLLLLGQLHDLVEGGRVEDGDVGQYLAIERDALKLQAMNQLAVAHAAHPTGGVDARDPQAAEVTLLGAAVAEGIDPAANQRHQRLPIQVVPAGAESLGQLAMAFAALRDRLAAAHS